MFVKTLTCSSCGATYPHTQIHTVCKSCGNTLLVEYDLESIREHLKKPAISTRTPTLWRYSEFLPLEDSHNIISLGEGFTPILQSKTKNLWIKDESLNPTGTFKSRGLAVAVSKAKELGIKDIVMPSAGNAAAALSFYCAKAGITAHVFMPEDSPEVTKRECTIAGAHVQYVTGSIKDAGAQAAKEKQRTWFDMSTLKEPYRLEGKKTMGLEIAEYFNWELPDVIIYPTGGGTGLIGIWKAVTELEEMDWITEKPRMISVQAAQCAPIVKAFTERRKTATEWENPHTIAAGLKVPTPFADHLILKTIKESKGTAVTVTDEEIVESIRELAQTEGVYACPEGAATYAGFKNLMDSAYISEKDRVVLINTGSGLKYPF